jgi:hypothetical protein
MHVQFFYVDISSSHSGAYLGAGQSDHIVIPQTDLCQCPPTIPLKGRPYPQLHFISVCGGSEGLGQGHLRETGGSCSRHG